MQLIAKCFFYEKYSALYKTAFKSGYSIIHPNCRHSWSPYHTELYSEEEKRQALERSNRSWQADGDGRRFQQTETLRTQYAAGQQKLRQWNAEILEYERMKAHYKGIGEESPYSTLGAFRRARRSDNLSPAFKAWRNRNRDAKLYEEWVSKIGKENLPENFDKFSKIKYNNSEEYQQILRDLDLYRQYKESVEKGKVTDVGFVVFKETLQQARKRLVGITVNESVVEEVSIHLIERIIGSETEKRKGVSIEKVAQVLEKGVLVKEKIDKQGRRGWTIHFDGVDVSYNPDKKMVIQCQPNTHRKVKNDKNNRKTKK